MALDDLSQLYPGQAESPTSAYPQGSAKNETSPGSLDGTPWEKQIINDHLGFFQALLAEGGVSPNGSPDTATASQYLNAVQSIISSAISAINLSQQIESGAGTVFDNKVDEPDADLVSLIESGAGTVFDNRVVEGSSKWSSPTGYVVRAASAYQRVSGFVTASFRMTTDSSPSGTATWVGAIPSAFRPPDQFSAVMTTRYATGYPLNEQLFRIEVKPNGDIMFDDMGRGPGNDGDYVATIAWSLTSLS